MYRGRILEEHIGLAGHFSIKVRIVGELINDNLVLFRVERSKPWPSTNPDLVIDRRLDSLDSARQLVIEYLSTLMDPRDVDINRISINDQY